MLCCLQPTPNNHERNESSENRTSPKSDGLEVECLFPTIVADADCGVARLGRSVAESHLRALDI